jgi:hypothetical protein
VKTKPLLGWPGTDFCQIPSPGTLSGAKSADRGPRARRSKRIHIRFVPAIAGIEPVNAAARSPAPAPETHEASLARRGGACACAAPGRARTAVAAMSAGRRMGT